MLVVLLVWIDEVFLDVVLGIIEMVSKVVSSATAFFFKQIENPPMDAVKIVTAEAISVSWRRSYPGIEISVHAVGINAQVEKIHYVILVASFSCKENAKDLN